MTASLRFGRIAGIPVGANWSALLIAGLIAWSLAGRLLPAQVPGLAPAAYWLAGAAGAGLFLGSLLAHELGHALVAQRAGLKVRGITLWLLGGVAQLEDEPASPRDELRVAIVGPAVSLALAVGSGLAALGLSVLGGPAVAVAIAAWLAVGNAALALFNLLPAAPLDGGRVLRACSGGATAAASGPRSPPPGPGSGSAAAWSPTASSDSSAAGGSGPCGPPWSAGSWSPRPARSATRRSSAPTSAACWPARS